MLYLLLLAIFSAMMDMEETNNMAKKDTKPKSFGYAYLRNIIILEEYCEVYGQTPSSTICGYIVEDLWQAPAGHAK